MTRMGLTVDCFPFGRKGATALDLLDYCHSLGAGGVEAPLGSLEAGYACKVRERAEKLGLYLEVWATLPREDAGEFERTVVAAKEAGAATRSSPRWRNGNDSWPSRAAASGARFRSSRKGTWRRRPRRLSRRG